jgi:MFS family permease
MPTINTVLSDWVPKSERSRAVSAIMFGGYFGFAFSNTISPIIMYNLGWTWIFYIFGVIGMIWSFIWLLFAHETPASHPSIHPQELEFILEHKTSSVNPDVGILVILKRIFTCVPVWALLINLFCSSFGSYIILSWLPTFFAEQFHPNVIQLSLLLAIPYLGTFSNITNFDQAKEFLVSAQQ